MKFPRRRRGAVKKCRQEPGLQPASKVFGIFVGRVPSRGVFESFHSSKGTEVVYRSRRIHREGYAFCPSQEGIFQRIEQALPARRGYSTCVILRTEE